MQNYVQPGKTVTVPAPYNVTSGEPVLVGALFGVSSAAYLSGEAMELATVGVFELPKAASQAWTVGAKVYFDAANKVITATAGSNVLVGHAVKAVGGGAGETIGRVRLANQA